MSQSSARSGKGASPRASWLAILPASLFDEAATGDLPYVGSLRRYSPRAGALLAYLHTIQDGETGAFRGGPSTWSSAIEHGRDPKTIAAALAELLGEVDTPAGGRIATVCRDEAGGYTMHPDLWAERCRVRAHRREGGTPYPWVGLRSSLIRGGPWQAMTDAARMTWLFLRRWAPAAARKDRKGAHVAENAVRRDEIAEAVGVSERTISECVELLVEIGLVARTRRRDSRGRFLPSLFRVALEYAGRALGQVVDWTRDVVSQVRSDVAPEHRRARLVEWWVTKRLKAWLEARGRRARAPARIVVALERARAS